MKHKPDASWNAGSTERRGVRQSLTRAGVQLGYVVTGALTSSLEALEERLDSGPPDSGGTAQSRMRELLNRDRAATRRGRVTHAQADEQSAYGYTGKQSGGTARGRMKELLNKDRAMIATLDDEPFSDLFEQSGTLPLPAAPVGAVAAPSVAPTPVAPAPVAQVPPAPVVPGPGASVIAALQSAVATMPRATVQQPPVAVMRAPVMVGIAGAARPGGPAPFATRPVPAPAGHAPVVEAAPAPVAAAPVPVTPAPLPEVAPPVPAVASAAPVASVVPVAGAAPALAKPAAKAMPVLRNQVPVGSAPVAAPAGDDADSPIRTRSMARLLALQGHRDRALSIYDELLIAEPDNADLRAEADRLRG